MKWLIYAPISTAVDAGVWMNNYIQQFYVDVNNWQRQRLNIG